MMRRARNTPPALPRTLWLLLLLAGCSSAELPAEPTSSREAGRTAGSPGLDLREAPERDAQPGLRKDSSPGHPVPATASPFAASPRGIVAESPATSTQSREATIAGEQPESARVAAGDLAPSLPVSAEFEPDEAGHARLVVPFLKRHCLTCHGPDTQEGEFRVDEQLPNDFVTRSVAARWSEVLNMLNSGEMPPDSQARPPADEVARVVEWITSQRLRGELVRRDTSIVLRRLNRTEYNNTLRDLIGVDMRPGDEFPADPAAGGFDNNGGALTISPLQLELYIEAAGKVLDRAIVTEAERPAKIKWRFQLEHGNQGLDRYRETIGGQRVIVNGGNSQFRDGMTVLRFDGWDRAAGFRDFRVPHAGTYVIRLRAAGHVPPEATARRAGPEFHELRQKQNEENASNPDERQRRRESFSKWVRPYVAEHFASDRRYHYGPPRIKLTGYLGGTPQIFGEFDVAAPVERPKIYEVTAWFEPIKAGVWAKNVYQIPEHNFNFWFQNHDDFPRPELLIDWMEIEGPIYQSWPPVAHRRIFIDSPHKGRDETAYARAVLAHFMRRAYRRPLREGEVDSKLTLFEQVRPGQASFEEAMKTPLTAVLVSPHFLYLVEDNHATLPAAGLPAGARSLDDYELASRLSYFLWSSMPDEELFRLADQRRLTDPKVLVAQADRMLADPRAGQLARNFAGQWLKLRDVGANPPAGNIYPRYDDHLELSMRGESEAFFRHILQNDLSVLNFIRSDFVTINERLARFYDIPGVKGDQFRAVEVPAGVPRGGLLTQASILSVTSNGTRTSPVARGVWILERLLGTPPPPPLPNAGDIPPGVPGLDKVTVRERLRLHREQPQCARCHNKIDPLGFALENFNAAGEWRDREARSNASEWNDNDPPIDASSELPDGTQIDGVAGLQSALLDRQNQFLRCLAEKMSVYALGRELGYADEPILQDAVAHMKRHRYTLRSLIHHIVQSKLFRTKSLVEDRKSTTARQ